MTPNPQDSAVALEVERAAFEAHLRAVWKVPESYLDWALTIRDGRYLDSRAQDQWGGWQARASQSDGTSGVPEGWKMVPVEPTEAMHAAAVRTIVRCIGNDDFPPRVYRAMLAAAPNQGENHVG